ncbi:MAG: hypothetical protein H6672_09120 [Anaerolineaceae bacterium]|nr:hypothetical protein [Anaerolineaceae bacterium]
MSNDLFIRDHQDHWLLPIEMGVVVRCTFDYGCVLEIAWRGLSINVRIEGDILFRTKDGEKILSGEDATLLTEILLILNQKVDSAKVFKDGKLVLDFSNEVTLAASSSVEYEAWQITSSNGLRIVCMPGGELAIWRPE